MNDRQVHSAEHQKPMKLHVGKPSCWADNATPRAPTFWDQGRACGAAMTPAVWQVTLAHTPGCSGCARARRAKELSAGVSGQYDAPFAWKEIDAAAPWYERYFRPGA